MLSHRIFVALIGIPLILFLIYLGGIPFLCFILIIIILGLREFYKLVQKQNFTPMKTIGILSALVLAIAIYSGIKNLDAFITGLILILFLARLYKQKIEGSFLDISITLFGIFYVGWLINHLILLRQLPFWGKEYTYLVFLATWSIDNAAYIMGVTLGRHKLAPKISPNKSIEGFVGGLIGGVLAVLIVKWWLLPNLSYVHCLGIGLSLGIIGQLGDLFESLIKRTSQVKDTGNLLPGHGGILDRFDSLLFTAPLLYYYIKFLF